MAGHFLNKVIAPIIPYITVGIGLLFLHNAWIAIIAYHLGMIIVVLFSREKIPLMTILSSTNYKIPLFTAMIGASGGILFYILWPILAIPPDINIYLQNIGLSQTSWPLFLVYFILVNPWLEEYYWRGYLGSNSKRIILDDIFFSGYHVIVMAGKVEIVWLLVLFVVISFGAWFWRQSNRISHGLLPSLVSHLAADITIILTIYRMTGIHYHLKSNLNFGRVSVCIIILITRQI